MECFRLLFNHLAWIEHQFMSGIRNSRKTQSLCGMMRGVGRVRKSIHQSWLAKGLGLGLICWGFKGVQEEIHWKRPALFKLGQWHFHQDNAPVHNSILVTDYFTKMGIKTVPQPTYSPDLAPCDFCLFPKLRGCHYETIEKMWRRSLTCSHKRTSTGPSRSCWNNKCIATGGDHCEEGLEFYVCTINKCAQTKKVWKLIVCTLVYIHTNTHTHTSYFMLQCTP